MPMQIGSRCVLSFVSKTGDANGPSSTLVGLFMPNGWLSNAGRTTSAAMPSSKCAKSPFCVPNCKCWTCDSSKRLSEHEGGLPIVVPWFAQKAFCPPPHPTSAASVSIKHTKPFVQQRLQCKTSSKQLQEIIEVYSNSSSPRGLALIIANDKFTNRRLPARPGSDVDVKNIKKLLAGLGYDIFANRNETAECSKNCGRGFRRRKVRCLAARNNSVRLDKGKCTEQNRPRRREPCFVRNCLPSDCAELREQNAHTTGMLDGNYTLCTILARHRGQAQARIFSVDFMVAHSSFPRYISWRCTAHGSWFIQAICKGFSEMAAQTDLLTMMTEVNALVQRLECHEDKGKNRRRKRVSL
uniref:Caspase family p20 domain-containing protein n=1 Tax=Globodera rostochiensis TaxID=31243 RepID=A0A914HLQ9_GLORO